MHLPGCWLCLYSFLQRILMSLRVPTKCISAVHDLISHTTSSHCPLKYPHLFFFQAGTKHVMLHDVLGKIKGFAGILMVQLFVCRSLPCYSYPESLPGLGEALLQGEETLFAGYASPFYPHSISRNSDKNLGPWSMCQASTQFAIPIPASGAQGIRRTCHVSNQLM